MEVRHSYLSLHASSEQNEKMGLVKLQRYRAKVVNLQHKLRHPFHFNRKSSHSWGLQVVYLNVSSVNRCQSRLRDHWLAFVSKFDIRVFHKRWFLTWVDVGWSSLPRQLHQLHPTRLWNLLQRQKILVWKAGVSHQHEGGSKSLNFAFCSYLIFDDFLQGQVHVSSQQGVHRMIYCSHKRSSALELSVEGRSSFH